jgi:hypothetical protein
MSTLLWVLPVFCVVALVGQTLFLRARYRRHLEQKEARHLEVQLATTDKLEKAKRQIGLLQKDLAAVRHELQQLGKSHAASVQRNLLDRKRLVEQLDDAPASRFSPPTDGFADTQPGASGTQYGTLLFQ